MTTCPACTLAPLSESSDRSGQTTFRACPICSFRDTVSNRAPENRLQHDDPTRYLRLFAADPTQHTQFVLYASNWFREKGTLCPIPSAAFDLLKDAGVDTSKMRPIKNTLIKENL